MSLGAKRLEIGLEFVQRYHLVREGEGKRWGGEEGEKRLDN